jgi:hypothetical protein
MIRREAVSPTLCEPAQRRVAARNISANLIRFAE